MRPGEKIVRVLNGRHRIWVRNSQRPVIQTIEKRHPTQFVEVLPYGGAIYAFKDFTNLAISSSRFPQEARALLTGSLVTTGICNPRSPSPYGNCEVL